MTARFTDEELMAYVDGEVDDENGRAIKAEATVDPEVARTIDMFAQTRVMARVAFRRYCTTECRTDGEWVVEIALHDAQ